ncbi:Uncharacterised protein [Vibrio cholerae]|nr:Uncharacterised protein [Vibrio cholerae]CSI54923.1 Uncharacterised protein [Vibrio cholerae]
MFRALQHGVMHQAPNRGFPSNMRTDGVDHTTVEQRLNGLPTFLVQ